MGAQQPAALVEPALRSRQTARHARRQNARVKHAPAADGTPAGSTLATRAGKLCRGSSCSRLTRAATVATVAIVALGAAHEQAGPAATRSWRGPHGKLFQQRLRQSGL